MKTRVSNFGNRIYDLDGDGLIVLFIRRDSNIRLLRDNVVIHSGKIDSLKRFKDEVKDVQQGYECGVTIQEFSDVQDGDIIETFQIKKELRKL